ncbi:helix-turn-helix domain-containing protein [Ruegeria profundi]|uniref:HTH araC/xylS-type domain-containing protein n=1 Tax=Ruegeria profundi TaxID=1685378 RepID=A0A0X3TMY7_9RHOB|nr:helix-turn-helix transcriptional regulator [Ruegeria profundi]KUJ77084.1 hypothetical protein AVO44_18745 [Ruegeria profundi]
MQGIVKIRYATNFAIACEAAGLDPMKFLAEVEINERMLAKQEEMISEHQLWRLAESLATATGKFDLGFDAGRVANLHEHGAMDLLFSKKTLFERMVTFCNLATHECSSADFVVRPVWNGVVFSRRAIVGSREQVRQVELYVLKLMLETVRSILGPAWRPTLLNLQSRHHADLEAIIHSDECRLRFEQAETELLIQNSEVATAARYALSSETPARHAPATQAATALVKTYLSDPRLSLAFVSRLLNCSERHLQRSLQKEGESFSHILSRARISAAMELLDDTALPIADISRSLGYSNQAHFTRAFLKITGATPTTFRKVSSSRSQA